MDIEDKIRSRIEAILINDARNHAEMARMASDDDEPLDSDPFSEERNLYQRMVNSYRSAVREVNNLLEENVGFLSGFYQFVENIKDKDDFEEICSQIVDCGLRDLGAEYCSLVFFEKEGEPGALCLEGIREDRKFLRIHSRADLLGSEELEKTLVGMVCESSECCNIGDVYREPQFLRVDFPSLVRSLVCLPISSSQKTIGLLIMSHSRPHYFNDNHIRVLKILAGFAAHLKLLTGKRASDAKKPEMLQDDLADVLSVTLLDFQIKDGYGRWISPNKDISRRIRSRLFEALEEKGSILFHGDRDLLVLLPGVPSEQLHAVVGRLRKAFHQWRANQSGQLESMRMNLGYATCDGEDDLDQALEVAAHLMHPELDQEPDFAAGSR